MSSVFESRDVKFYKKNFDSLAKIPFVRQLLKENEKLKKENADLKHTVFKLCKKMLEKEETKMSTNSVIDEQDDDCCCVVVLEKENIVYEIEEDEDIEDEINKIKVKTECVAEEVVVEEEEEEVVVEEEEVVVEEEEVVVEEEEEEEEVVVEEEEEEEEEVVVEEEEEDAEVYEITIQSKTYYVTNEIDSIIYEADASGDISIEAGIYKNGKPTFYKK